MVLCCNTSFDYVRFWIECFYAIIGTESCNPDFGNGELSRIEETVNSICTTVEGNLQPKFSLYPVLQHGLCQGLSCFFLMRCGSRYLYLGRLRGVTWHWIVLLLCSYPRQTDFLFHVRAAFII